MKTYLISFNLSSLTVLLNREKFFTTLKSFGYWAQINENVWLVKTNYSSLNIVTMLKTLYNYQDNVFVIEVTKDWSAFGFNPETVNWMKSMI